MTIHAIPATATVMCGILCFAVLYASITDMQIVRTVTLWMFKERNMSDFEVVLPTTTEEWQRDMNIAYNKALDKVDEIITEQLDKSDNQVECQTLRWVLDVLSDLIK